MKVKYKAILHAIRQWLQQIYKPSKWEVPIHFSSSQDMIIVFKGKIIYDNIDFLVNFFCSWNVEIRANLINSTELQSQGLTFFRLLFFSLPLFRLTFQTWMKFRNLLNDININLECRSVCVWLKEIKSQRIKSYRKNDFKNCKLLFHSLDFICHSISCTQIHDWLAGWLVDWC